MYQFESANCDEQQPETQTVEVAASPHVFVLVVILRSIEDAVDPGNMYIDSQALSLFRPHPDYCSLCYICPASEPTNAWQARSVFFKTNFFKILLKRKGGNSYIKKKHCYA